MRIVTKDVKLRSATNVPFKTSVLSYSNYYPFGMAQPGRMYSTADFRYGYNGKEEDGEIKGEGNSYDYDARIYDPRVGRFLSVDPQWHETPDWSPYRAFFDNPMYYIDSDGEREKNALKYANYKLTTLPSTYNPTISAKFAKTTEIPAYMDCKQLVYLSYMRVEGNPYGKAGFPMSRQSMFNWFKNPDLKSEIKRELLSGPLGESGVPEISAENILKAQEGDVLFLARVEDPWGSNHGHVVMVNSVTAYRNKDGEITAIDVVVTGAYALRGPGVIPGTDIFYPEVPYSGFETITLTPAELKDGQKNPEFVPGVPNGEPETIVGPVPSKKSVSDSKQTIWHASHSNYTVLGIGQVKEKKDEKKDEKKE